ncbi:phage regulatory CII family protein [Achromobacter xylosoxidans]|uniref:phage regulatory CII family protein n=1 Tax=Alcaligenes xylosoxydans xylosoxydans TaxID=85698 RepID=UPI000B48B6FD|nr:phage regulatory CII family protein [Achromobacter xylosoxidans]
MTKRHSSGHWRGALYNSLRMAADGLQGFCVWAAGNRDRRIALKTLYKRLDGTSPAERMPIEDAELITEYLLRDAHAQDYALDWLKALCARFGLVAIELDAPPPNGGWPCEITAIVEKGFQITEKGGLISGVISRAIADRKISPREADQITELAHAEVQLLLRLVRNVQRAAEMRSTVAAADRCADE